jgi:adenylate cyclase
MIKKFNLRKLNLRKLALAAVAAVASAVLTVLLFSGLLESLDNRLADSLYYRQVPSEANIYIIGIDERALEQLGPFNTWTRSYFAAVIEKLNADPERRPAVIGIDVMFFGNTSAVHDQRLVAACAEYGNVVVAAHAEFSTAIVEADGVAQLDSGALASLEVPFPELQAAATVGHINFQPERDGIVRRAMQYIDLPPEMARRAGTERLPSFALMIYQKYAQVNGLPTDPQVPMEGRYNLWRFPYTAKPEGFYDGFSVSDILNDELPLGIFADSVVLIGPYAAGMMDSAMTPMSAAPMYGVEIHANVIDAMTRGVYYAKVPTVTIGIITFAVFFLLFMAFFLLHPGPSAVLLAVAAGAYLALAYQMVFPSNPESFLYGEYGNVRYLLPTVQLPLGAFVIYVGMLVYKFITEQGQRKKVTDTFKKYVDPAIIADISATGLDKLDLGGKLCDICVMFIDIRGFTPMSEKMSPPEVVNMLNDYLEITSSEIFKYGGTLDKFIGDATMAFWGAPIAQDDMVYKAACAAQDIAKRGRQMEATLRDKYDTTVSFGIGLHYGEAVVGNIGTARRMDYTAIGNTVNTAARLESNAKAGQILISETVFHALEGRIYAQRLGNIPLKGKSEELIVYEMHNVW